MYIANNNMSMMFLSRSCCRWARSSLLVVTLFLLWVDHCTMSSAISSAHSAQGGAGYLLGADLGTESVRVGLFDLQGELIHSDSEAYITSFPQTGWAEQSPNEWWSQLSACCRKVRYPPGSTGHLIKHR